MLNSLHAVQENVIHAFLMMREMFTHVVQTRMEFWDTKNMKINRKTKGARYLKKLIIFSKTQSKFVQSQVGIATSWPCLKPIKSTAGDPTNIISSSFRIRTSVKRKMHQSQSKLNNQG
jgi:hypothetical protein